MDNKVDHVSVCFQIKISSTYFCKKTTTTTPQQYNEILLYWKCNYLHDTICQDRVATCLKAKD